MNLSQYKNVLTISLPLVLSMGATTVMEFTDRVFLGNYDLNTLAAATPAGITSFLFTAFFLVMVRYRGGKWKAMAVIENPLPTVPAQVSL